MFILNNEFIWYYFIYSCVVVMILSWGTQEFDGIITSLETTMSEFIPYVVYVGLWVLGAIIWFVAVKWLMNWVRAKVLWTFSWGRRRR